MVWRSIELHKAVANPADFFSSPEEVVADFRLDRRVKIAILRSWEHILAGDGDTDDAAARTDQLADRVRGARRLLERSQRRPHD